MKPRVLFATGLLAEPSFCLVSGTREGTPTQGLAITGASNASNGLLDDGSLAKEARNLDCEL